MLVLTRRAGECVRIGSEVRIVVLSAAGGQVRIGIDAPAQVAVHREEVYERIVSANQEAAAFQDVDLDLLWPPDEKPEQGEGE